MEVDLLTKYPKRDRNVITRKHEKTDKIIKTAREFGWEYFDKKGVCYGGYSYDGRWVPVVNDFIDHYNLKEGDKILDVGCAKGYMVHDFISVGIDAYGCDISRYALDNSMNNLKNRLTYCNCKDLSIYAKDEFDLVISINTVHNLDEEDCRKAIREIEIIGKNKYIVVDSYRNEEEKQRMYDWNVTGRTVLSSEEWKVLFEEEGYTGDYYWFIP